MARPKPSLYRPVIKAAAESQPPPEHAIFLRAQHSEGVADEIALLRTRIATVAAYTHIGEPGSLEWTRLMCRMVECLCALIRVQHALGDADTDLSTDMARINTNYLTFLKNQREQVG